MSEESSTLLAELTERLKGWESLEIEFKRGKGGLPNSLWPTISAFANTNGGWIILGVRDDGGEAELEGLKKPQRRLQELHNLLRNPQKVSFPTCGADDLEVVRVDNKDVLVVRVPAASRKNRPVYIAGNPYQGTYLRRNEGDYLCTKREVDRMMREASDVATDSTVLSGYSIEDLDSESISRYRQRHQNADPGSPWNGYDDVRFLKALKAIGLDRESGKEGITVAGLLLFGTPGAIGDWRPRHLIDFRILPSDGGIHERWTDRVTWDGNLIGAFEEIYPRLVHNLPKPFVVRDGVRVEDSPAHVAMREALVNLLVHADYSESDASLVFRDDHGCLFQNPGNSRVPAADLLSGDRSDPRNPKLVSAFRFIGLADEAGTGIPKIFRAWHELGLKAPKIDIGTERYQFAIRLRYIHFLSDEDREWLMGLGDGEDWNESEQIALVHAKENETINNRALCTLTGEHSTDATKTLTGLRDRGYLVRRRGGRWTYYELSRSSLHALEFTRSARLVAESQPGLFDQVTSKPASPKSTHTRQFNDYLRGLIVSLVKSEGRVTRAQIDSLLLDLLPDDLDQKQKKSKVHNLLGYLSKKNVIRNEGSKTKPEWVFVEDANGA